MSALQRLWKDRMDIKRHSDMEVDGVTKNIEQLIAVDVKCHYSKGSLADTGDGVPALVNSHRLFCALTADVLPGDKLIVTQRNGSVIKLTAGEGMPYSEHWEFSVKRDDKA